MSTSKSIVVNSVASPLDVKIEARPIPQAAPGQAVVEVLSAVITPNSGFSLTIPVPTFQFPTPAVYGSAAIGRIVSVGHDSTALQPGQLVLVDSFVTSRDDPDVAVLMGPMDGGTDKSKKLANAAWRDGSWAKHCVVPLENATPLNEDVLVRQQGHRYSELLYLTRHAVTYGGVSAIDVKAGETVLVGPATGHFGGAAVEVAAARGARVIAFGRNRDALAQLRAHIPRVETVALTGDGEADTAAMRAFGPVDAYIDFSPFQAQNPTYIGAAIQALGPRSRVALMGAPPGDISIPYWHIVMNSIEIKGRWMYSRKEIRELVKMVETGVLKIGKPAGHEIVAEFPLEEYEKALELATKSNAWG
jgi:threonine dehydrogenase-like Zn-dependent dehydrogenase